jgi:Bacterial Ig-like domain (group 3)
MVIKADLRGPGGLMLSWARAAPSNATGTVVFRDGNATIAGPVPVIGGFAIDGLSFLGEGQHSITAVFTPANPTAFQSSTSNIVTFTF